MSSFINGYLQKVAGSEDPNYESKIKEQIDAGLSRFGKTVGAGAAGAGIGALGGGLLGAYAGKKSSPGRKAALILALASLGAGGGMIAGGKIGEQVFK